MKFKLKTFLNSGINEGEKTRELYYSRWLPCSTALSSSAPETYLLRHSRESGGGGRRRWPPMFDHLRFPAVDN